MRTLLLTGTSPGGELPDAPVLAELSPGLPLLSSSSGDPTLRRVGSLVLAGTEVLFSIPPGKIWNTVLPFQGSVTFDAGGSEERQSSS